MPQFKLNRGIVLRALICDITSLIFLCKYLFVRQFVKEQEERTDCEHQKVKHSTDNKCVCNADFIRFEKTVYKTASALAENEIKQEIYEHENWCNQKFLKGLTFTIIKEEYITQNKQHRGYCMKIEKRPLKIHVICS